MVQWGNSIFYRLILRHALSKYEPINLLALFYPKKSVHLSRHLFRLINGPHLNNENTLSISHHF